MDPNIENIVEDNVLESGEQASVLQEDATDNLEVGIPAVTIESHPTCAGQQPLGRSPPT